MEYYLVERYDDKSRHVIGRGKNTESKDYEMFGPVPKVNGEPVKDPACLIVEDEYIEGENPQKTGRKLISVNEDRHKEMETAKAEEGKKRQTQQEKRLAEESYLRKVNWPLASPVDVRRALAFIFGD